MVYAQWGGGGPHVKMAVVLIVPFRDNKVVLLPLRVFSLKKPTAGDFVVSFGGLS